MVDHGGDAGGKVTQVNALQGLFPEYAGKEQGKLRALTLAAIERRDAAGARRSMQADLNQTADYLIAQLSAA